MVFALCIVVAHMSLSFSVMRQPSLFNTREQSFLENAGVFLASVIDTEGVDA